MIPKKDLIIYDYDRKYLFPATTRIEDIEVGDEDAETPTYNLSGQRICANAKALTLRNGRKILIK